MARDARMIGPVALSALAHALALAILVVTAQLHSLTPPIPIELRHTHRTVEKRAPVERKAPPPKPEPRPEPTHASTHGGTRRPKPIPPPPPPETSDLAPFAPDDANLVVLLRMEKLRTSPYRATIEALLGVLPDWRTLVEGSEVNPLDDFDALLVATADPRDATATFLAARYPDSPKVRALTERPLPPNDPRVFRVVKPGLTILTRPEELQPGDMGDARLEWIHQLEKFDDMARAPGGPAVLATLADVQALLRFGNGIPTPQTLAVALTADAAIQIRVRAGFETEDEATALMQKWPEIMERYRSLTMLLGFSTALDGLKIDRKGLIVEVAGKLPEDQLKRAFGMLLPLLPHPRPAQ
jgi:hypothetical protein